MNATPIAVVVKSTGLKRKIAGYFSAVLEILRYTPALTQFVPFVETVAGIFGVAGVAHAGAAGTIDKQKVLSLASIVAALVSAATFIPILLPYVPLLQKLAGILGAIGLGLNVKTSNSRT